MELSKKSIIFVVEKRNKDNNNKSKIKIMNQKKIKFEIKPLVSLDEYVNGVPEMTPEEKKKADMINKFCYGTSDPLWK